MPTTDKRPLKVFLCHASTDKPKVRELYRYLRRRGINPWFDEEHLVGGQDWQVEIPKALATSDAIIICLTKNSIDREGYIQKEIKFALDKALEMPEGRIFLIPVKFEECEVPFTLNRYQWVDLTVESGYAKMMKALKFRASQLERSTVEVSKKDVEEENLAREKKEREAAERVEKERNEKEFREKQSREAREKEKRESEKKEEKTVTAKPKTGGQIAYWFGGFIVLILGIIFLSSLNNPPSTPQPTPEVTQTQAIATFAQNTVEPSATAIPKSTSTPVSTFTPTPLPTKITDAKALSMVLVPAGEFTMGSDTSNDDEKPVHQVYLNAFYMDIYEVTNWAYKDCVDANVCTSPAPRPRNSYGVYWGDYYSWDFNPIASVSWEQAQTFCEWRSARLPTEAEWEKAARGIDGRTYPWGEEVSCANANYSGCNDYAVSVGANQSPNPYGVYDMAGNVWEWVADWYSEGYYVDSPLINPLGPTSGEYRVIRGGAWNNFESSIRTTIRKWENPNNRRQDLGFRCAKDANP